MSRRLLAVAGSALGVLLLVCSPQATAVVDSSAAEPAYSQCVAKFRAAGLGGLVNRLNGPFSHKFVITSYPVGSGATDDDDGDAANPAKGSGGSVLWNPSAHGNFFGE